MLSKVRALLAIDRKLRFHDLMEGRDSKEDERRCNGPSVRCMIFSGRSDTMAAALRRSAGNLCSVSGKNDSGPRRIMEGTQSVAIAIMLILDAEEEGCSYFWVRRVKWVNERMPCSTLSAVSVHHYSPISACQSGVCKYLNTLR